jgi:hypothetical protein
VGGPAAQHVVAPGAEELVAPRAEPFRLPGARWARQAELVHGAQEWVAPRVGPAHGAQERVAHRAVPVDAVQEGEAVEPGVAPPALPALAGTADAPEEYFARRLAELVGGVGFGQAAAAVPSAAGPDVVPKQGPGRFLQPG